MEKEEIPSGEYIFLGPTKLNLHVFNRVYRQNAPPDAPPFKMQCVNYDTYVDGTYAILRYKTIGPTWRKGDYDTFSQISGHIGNVKIFEEY